MAPWPSPTKKWHSSSYPSIDPTLPELSLAGKCVVVTGGGSGIGLAISKALALAGASKIAIIGRRIEVLKKAAAIVKHLVGNTTQVFSVSADVGNKMQVDDAFDRIREEFGQPLDILVNNAGYYTGQRPFGTETVDEWTTAFNINIKGLYLVATAFISNAVTEAKIINISTVVAYLDAKYFPGFSSYASTKAAGTKIMEYIQAENPLLHVVDVHPGQIAETDMAGKIGIQKHVDDSELLLFRSKI
jgi:NAD(P)-dependent dehydrogenase (short-subunit alcohol dehydrogenase family)